MNSFENLEPKRVFHYFKEMCGIPRGSGNMKGIADYCVEFARNHPLEYHRDDADNVIIYKGATAGYEQSEPIILQGHLDIVCQKTEESAIDFLKDGIEPFIDGDFIKANGTTLGADNGIAAAMILSVLESDAIPHPAIEAVFTTDEEIGMIGASKLDMSLLSAKKMINLDSEEEDLLTVSCAGGSDFLVTLPVKRETICGTEVTIRLKGLKGGHSGVEIDKHRVNANTLAGRLLNHIRASCNFDIISVDGGDKANAITNLCVIKLVTETAEKLCSEAKDYLAVIKEEISSNEEGFYAEIAAGETGKHETFSADIITHILCTTPDGIMTMSAEIEGLVETSLNLGILKTENDAVTLQYALRSNKQSGLDFLEEKMKAYFEFIPCNIETFGHYPPWEFNSNSTLQELYKDAYKEIKGKEITTQALHAGLECGVFAAKITGFDCIAVGPDIFDVHTVNEKLSIKSVESFYKILIKVLEKSI